MIVTQTKAVPLADSTNEKLVTLVAFCGNPNLAKVLYDKFNISDLTTSARLSYLSGNFIEAMDLAKKANDVYLQCEILIATNKFKEALSVLKDLPLEPEYFYYSGVTYTHLQEYKKAIACFEKAFEGFKSDAFEIRKLMTLTNMAVALNRNGEIPRATAIFNTAAKLIKRSDAKEFPRFCSKFFVSYGFQMMQTGKLILAYKYLKLAEKLVNQNRSEEYFRCQVFLGYVTKQLGYYQKTISILKNLEPTVAYLNIDRLRYLAEAYLNLGDKEKSKEIINQALLLAGEDKFSRIFLDLQKYQIQIIENDVDSEMTFSEIKTLCNELNDQVSLSFAMGKKAYYTNDAILARIEGDKLNELQFHLESLECALVIAKRNLSIGSHQKALTAIDNLDFKSAPVQHIEALLLKAICYKILGRKLNSYSAVNTAIRLSLVRKDRFLIAKCLLIQLHINSDLSDLFRIQNEFTNVLHRLEPWQKRILINFLPSVNCEGKFQINIKSDKFDLTLIEFAKLAANEEGLFLDLESQTLIYGQKTFDDLKDFPVQWSMLQTLAKHSASNPLTKERIVIDVLGRKSYNPISDDNNINVTLHRIRKNLKKIVGYDPVICKNGEYFLSAEIKVIILEKFHPLRSLHVS